MFSLLAASAVVELLLAAVPWLWRVRKVVAPILVVAVSFAAGGLVAARWNACSATLLLLSLYRVINFLRMVEGRMNEAYLRRATRVCGWWLIGLQMAVGGVWALVDHLSVAVHLWWQTLAWMQSVVALGLLISTVRNVRATQPRVRAARAHVTDRDLPAVSIAIPARNEDEQLETCLRAALASNYPKLEIVVLDDCSQDKTAEVIRGFAHDGVRFIPGKEPTSDSWLAKNAAYARLAEEVSGEIILFCGVDVRLAPNSVRQLVAMMAEHRKTMMSVLPANMSRRVSWVQSMRYFWELAPPRRLFNRPPVLSSCWLITAEQLKKAGGFAAVSRSIVPEAHFARAAAANDAYRFTHSNALLGVTSIKAVAEQRATAVRTYYPQLHRRPEMVFAVTMAESLALLAPFALLFVAVVWQWHAALQIAVAATCVALLAAYRAVVAVSFPAARSGLLPLFPVVLLFDLALLHYSMWKYEFSEVVWKGRNVCIPVMRAIPHLPKLD